jgi:SpoVK/Ycf46/Vps4 family AAA+-type ATPase
VAAAVQEVIRDYHARERLEAHGLKPSRTLLMHGPPGNGKTSVAGALAAALSLPLYILRMGGLEESLVGLTEKKMIAAFDCLKAGPAMLFMDEADSILGTRTSVNHGSDAHRNGAINTMLQLIDETEAHTYLVAATNRAGDMDAAILRRFELHLELPRPTAAGLAEFFRGFVRAKAGDYPVTLDPAEVGLYAELRGDSFATLEQRCTRALRSHVIELPRSVLDQHLRAQLLPHAEPARSGDLEVAATENPAPRGRKRATAPRAAAPQPAEAAA